MGDTCTYKDAICGDKVNQVGHEGTELKFEAFASYAIAWVNKMIGFTNKKGDKYQNFNFIDCMASSGLYINEDDKAFIDGTAIRIINIFKSMALKHPDKKFNIYLNDYEPQYIKCLRCIENRYKSNNDFPKNLNIEISELDKNDFIQKKLSEKEFKVYGTANLIIYDPYDVDFDWNILKSMFELNADFLITHFFPNDTKRALTVVKDEKHKLRYAKSYGTSFDDLLETYLSKETVYDRNAYLRNLFAEQLMKNSDKGFTCYAPVFADAKKLHVYDIVCLSHSTRALELLKRTMYNLYSQKNEIAVHAMAIEQMSWFVQDEDDTYKNRREQGISEFNFHYNDREILKQFIETFKGKEMTQNEYYETLRRHPYLPPQIKEMVKKIWKYTIKREDSISVYCFPKGGLYEQNEN